MQHISRTLIPCFNNGLMGDLAIKQNAGVTFALN